MSWFQLRDAASPIVAADAGTKRFFIEGSDGYPSTTDENGIEVSLRGPQGNDGVDGANGSTGATGDTGPAGPAGPAGPVDLLYKAQEVLTITIGNSTSPVLIEEYTFNVPTTGTFLLQSVINFKAHSSSNDLEIEWRLDGSTLPCNLVEEFKDTGNAQRNPRPFQDDLGTLTAGDHTLSLYGSKESTGGTARINYLSLFVWRVS